MLRRKAAAGKGASGQVVRSLMMVLWVLGYGNAQLESTPYIDGSSSDMSSAAPPATSTVSASTTLAAILLTTPLLEDHLLLMRQRSKLNRLETIRRTILGQLGWQEPPSVTPEVRSRIPEVLEIFPNLTVLESQTTTERHYCYSASCNAPQSVNNTLWRDPSNLGLRLYIPVPREPHLDVETQSATLQLFLKPNPLSSNCPCFEGEEEDENQSTSRLLVSVYKFLRPLTMRRRGRLVNRRRLLDAQIASSSGNAWVTLNISAALRDWRRNRPNFGFEVTVKLDNDRDIDAKQLFVQASCDGSREIGCREDESESIETLPWTYTNYLDNHPYVEITSRRRRVRRSDAEQSPGARKSARQGPVTARASSDEALVNTSCTGKSVRIKVRDERLLWPRYFQSRICPHTCWECKDNQKCLRRSCRPPRTEPLRGLLRPSPDARPRHAVLPFVRVVECGC